MAKNDAPKRGPKPERIKLQGDWQNAIGKALKIERPKEGWPQPEKKKAKKKGR